MHKITKKEIEKRAVMEIINYFEPQIEAIIRQSVVELNKKVCIQKKGLIKIA